MSITIQHSIIILFVLLSVFILLRPLILRKKPGCGTCGSSKGCSVDLEKFAREIDEKG